ncbi:MAG: NUDIX domain-containing protein [Candidatus Thalassarchaeaceae archaeon]|nr:NUDIX domain-containing protein [Candidatus Thalassarchaeaceae archaeon]MDP7042896.1 NUDIX domain-containing protein [Candidatus Thalassarchaeaceae archaeon]
MSVEVWLTGFEPFGGHDDNISQIISEVLDGFQDTISLGDASGPYAAEFRESEVEIKAETLSVDEVGTNVIAKRLLSKAPQAVIHLGLAENRDVISIEATAFNELNFRMADNGGRIIESGCVSESGHNLLHSTAPINLIMAELDGDERIVKSENPGRFICNEIYFRTLNAIEEGDCRDRIGRTLPVLFVHLPPSDKLPLETQVELVKRIVALTVQRPQMEVVGGMLRDEKNRLLAARRGPEEYMSGYWEFPGGKVEKGEEHDAALEREYLEEFGWQIKPLRVCEEYSHAWPEMVVHLTFFLCEVDTELPPAVMTSHDEFRWLSEDQLMDVEWLPPDVEFVNRIKERGIANL